VTERATQTANADANGVRQAAAILRRGGLVAFLTETVYGLGADAENETAMRALFAAKGRPADHPVIMHLADATLIDRYVAELLPAARKLANAFWPGPMTLVLQRSERVSDLVTGGLATVGIRVPGHPVALALLREFGGPIAAPSANRFGRVSCTRAEHVQQELGGHIDLILDGGACSVGVESTIIDVSRPQPAILRPGAVTAEQIAGVLRQAIGGPVAGAPRVSGSLPSHYAPRASVQVVPPDQLQARAIELAARGQKVAVLSREPLFIKEPNIVVLTVPHADDDLARELYATLRRVDELGCDVVLTTLPIEQGLGTAIADRLRRAAGPRERNKDS
jgi:L-threonylcarbamoyladenylate synthase